MEEVVVIHQADLEIGEGMPSKGQDPFSRSEAIVFADDHQAGDSEFAGRRLEIGEVEGRGEEDESDNPAGLVDGEARGHQSTET